MSIRDAIRGYYPVGGMRAIIALAQGRILGGTPVIPVKAPGAARSVWLRVRTTDMIAFRQVFVGRQYELPLHSPPRVIVDAGAHLGFTSIFFANRYPGASIYSIEAAESNFRMLVRNVAPYPNVIPIHTALWHKDGIIAISGPQCVSGDFGEILGYDAFRVSEREASESPKERVPAATLETVMAQYKIECVDLLKLDIEGAEKEVLESSGRWINSIQALAIETHDSIKPGCTRALESAVGSFAFHCTNGEIEYFSRQ